MVGSPNNSMETVFVIPHIGFSQNQLSILSQHGQSTEVPFVIDEYGAHKESCLKSKLFHTHQGFSIISESIKVFVSKCCINVRFQYSSHMKVGVSIYSCCSDNSNPHEIRY